ncbi:hypothetical protein FDECE_17429 [Fusarium decemcellulare]|nr:hypothetical protein FDECE_17429 [Fusarium decemcellulare]
MGHKAIQLRSQGANEGELGQYLESLVGHPIPIAPTYPPIYFFVTTDENLEKLKEKYGDRVNITSHEVDED